MRLFSLLVLLSLAGLASADYTGHRVVDFRLDSATSRLAFASLQKRAELDVWHRTPTSARVMVPPSVELSLAHSVVHGDVEALVQEEKTRLAAQKPFAGGLGDFFTEWHTYPEYVAWITELSTTFPKRVSVVHIGQTYENNTILGLSITTADRATAPAVVYIGGEHAREWISPATMTYLALQFANNTDPEVEGLLGAINYIIVPVFNVDGFIYTQEKRLWRKTRQRTDGFCRGVDPNRAWPYKWEKGGSTCSETYSGETPGSPPIIQSMIAYLKTLPAVAGFVDFHAFGYLWMSPWAWTESELPSFFPASIDLSKRVAQAIYDVHQRQFTIGEISKVIYEAPGSSADYVASAYNTSYAYGVELRGDNFVLSPDNIIPSGQEIWAGVKVMGAQIKSEL